MRTCRRDRVPWPVKRYEPYFSASETYDAEAFVTFAAVLHYDPIGRLIRTDFPNGTHSRVDFDAWRSVSYDENDTLVADTPWYQARAFGTYLREPTLEQDAAEKAFALRDTPTFEHADSLGRSIAIVRDAGTTAPKPLHETDLPPKFRTKRNLREDGLGPQMEAPRCARAYSPSGRL